MTKAVWKYPVKVGGLTDDFSLRMPKGANVLSVGYDHATQGPAFWAMVSTEETETELKQFSVRGTGHGAADLDDDRFLGTVIYPTLPLVFHFWEWTGA